MKRNTKIFSILLGASMVMTSCGIKENTADLIQSGESITIEIAEPESPEYNLKSDLDWTRLDKLTTNKDFRNSYDKILGIETKDNSKYGILYEYGISDLVKGRLAGKQAEEIHDITEHNGNNTLFNAFLTEDFMHNYWRDDNTQKEVTKAVNKTYTDTDDFTDEQTQYVALNTYFNLLPDDNKKGTFDGSDTLSRAEAMTMVARAETPVTKSGKPESSNEEDFEKTVNASKDKEASKYAPYAAYVDESAYLNTSDKSLNEKTFTDTMTRGEFIYLLINRYYPAQFNGIELTDSDTLKDVKNAGNIKKTQKYNGDYANSYELYYSIQHPDDGVSDDMYKALIIAKNICLIDASKDTRWDDGITKLEAIELLTKAYNGLYESQTSDYEYTQDNEKVSTADYDTHSSEQNEVDAVTEQIYAYFNIDTTGNRTVARAELKKKAQEAGADGLDSGNLFRYEHGSGAGDGESYCLNPATGEKVGLGGRLPGGRTYYGTGDELAIAQGRELARLYGTEDNGGADDGIYVEITPDGELGDLIIE